MTEFLLGALVMASTTVGVFFMRFWRNTGDRLFVMFALAFWILSINWVAVAVAATPETQTFFYTLRLLAFLLIIIAVVDKNRVSEGREK